MAETIRRHSDDYKMRQEAARKRRLKISAERTKTELDIESEVYQCQE